MDERCFELASRHVGEGYVRQATEAMSGLNTKMRLLLRWNRQRVTCYMKLNLILMWAFRGHLSVT